MDTAEFFIKGLIVGFVVAAPVGPVAVMCIHRTIVYGRVAGYVCGLGATCADSIFGAIAALGLGFIATDLISSHHWLRLVGGLVLLALGAKLVLSRHLPPRAERQEVEEEREQRLAPARSESGLQFHLGNFTACFAIMITNPITLISFAGIFAFIDITGIEDFARWGLSLVAGVALGAALWWMLLVLVAGQIRHHIDEHTIVWINRVSGVLLVAFGAIVLFYPTSLNHGAHPQRAAAQAAATPAKTLSGAARPDVRNVK